MPTPNLSEIITTTQRNRSKVIADNVSQAAALLARLRTKGKNKLVSGGRTIVQELSFAETSSFMYYSGYELLDTSVTDVLSAAEYDWKQAAVSVSISGLEELQNAGPEAVIDLLESRMENAERTLKNNISAGLYSDGTGSGGKQITGLQSQVAAVNTNTVGGIDASAYSFWRNVSFSSASDGGTAATAGNIQSYMNRVYLQLVRGNDAPDLIVADNNYFRLYLESLQAIQRITGSTDMASAGFQSLKYMNADVVLDGGRGGDAPTNTMYFLNTDYLFFKTHRERNFVPLGSGRQAVNQDATVKFMAWAGNLTCANRSLQGVLRA